MTEPSKPISLFKLWLFRLILVFVPLALAVAGVEMVAKHRFLAMHRGFVNAVNEYAETGKLPPSQWEPHPIWHHRLNPDYPFNHLNKYGFRGLDFPKDKKAGEFRVVCVGDSTTQGAGLVFDHTYPFFLERFLSMAMEGRPVTVINAGIGSHNTAFNIAYLGAYLVDFSPDFVLIKSSYNDYAPFTLSGFDGDYTISFPEIFTMETFPYPAPVWARRSYMGKYYYARRLAKSQQRFILGMNLGAQIVPSTIDSNLKLANIYGHRIRALAGIASANGATPLFLDLPYSHRPGGTPGLMARIFGAFNLQIVQTAGSLKADLAATQGALTEADFIDSVHNSSQGHQRIAALAANRILTRLGSKISYREFPLSPTALSSPALFEKDHPLSDAAKPDEDGYALIPAPAGGRNQVPIFIAIGKPIGESRLIVSFHEADATARLSAFIRSGSGEWEPRLTLDNPRRNPAMPDLAIIPIPAGATGVKLLFEAASQTAVSLNRINIWEMKAGN
jgi:hypothetical protein